LSRGFLVKQGLHLLVKLLITCPTVRPGPRKFHGQGGMMNTEQPRYDTLLHEDFFRAAAAAGLGLKPNPDFNDWSRPQVRGVQQRESSRGSLAKLEQQRESSRGSVGK
jgi:hypothetical protein